MDLTPELIEKDLEKLKHSAVDWDRPETIMRRCGNLLQHPLVRAEIHDAPNAAQQVEVLRAVLTRLTDRIASREEQHPPRGNAFADASRLVLRLEALPLGSGTSLDDILAHLASAWKRQTGEGPRPFASGSSFRRHQLPKIYGAIGAELALMTEEAGLSISGKPQDSASACFDFDGLEQLFTQVMPGSRTELQQVFQTLVSANLQQKILRSNWLINVSFDLASVNDGVIAEVLTWDFELVNISRDPIPYDVMITSEESDRLKMRAESFEQISPGGERVSILDEDEFRGAGEVFVTKTKSVIMEPGVRYALRLHFRQEWSINPKMPRIYNVFGSSLPCINTTLRFVVPSGFALACVRMHEHLKPREFSGYTEFVVPGVTPVGMMIEYVLRPTALSDSKK